jgi:hypothetical protein
VIAGSASLGEAVDEEVEQQFGALVRVAGRKVAGHVDQVREALG